MKKVRWQLLIVVLALTVIGLLLLSQQPDVLPISNPISTPQPVSGGVYTEGLVGTPGRFNPVLDAYNPADQDINRVLYSRLVDFDDRGLPIPDLAESWGISQNGEVYNFSLRPNAVWHDGEPVTTGDVLFTIELLQSEELPIPEDIRTLWDNVEVEAPNDYLMQFRLPEPFAPFLDYLNFGILPEHLLADADPVDLVEDPFNLHPVGSGPYQFEEYMVEEGEITGVVLQAFDDYYQGRPFIDELVFRYFSNAESALEAYREDEIMGISQITAEILPEALAEPEMNLYTGRLPQLTLIFLNLDNAELPFFQETTVREALYKAINRQWIIDHLLQGQAIKANGPLLPGSWGHYEGIEDVEYDPEKAISLLKSAGYTIPAEGGQVRTKDEVGLSFTLIHPVIEPYPAIADRIQRDWAAIGVSVELEPVAYEELVTEFLAPRVYEAALVDLDLSRSPDPDPYPFWHQAQVTGGQNYSKWDDRQASEYLEQARVTVERTERTRLYHNFQIRFARELPSLPLFYPVYTYGVDAEVRSVQMGPLFDQSDRLRNVQSWFLRAAVTSEGGNVEPTASP